VKLRRFARQALNASRIMREPLFSPPGHFYSPISSIADGSRARAQRPGLALDAGYDLRAEEQLEFADRLGPKWADFSTSWRRYNPVNRMYGSSDGAVYYSMLTTLRPKKVVEVGSGFSSAIALDCRDQQLHDLELTFIEPYPERLLGLLKEGDKSTTTLHQSAVQDVPIEVFDVLDNGDILFIDSTHVSKPGSDVNLLLFRVLPRLKPGVIVHVHDIFYPFEYPDEWLTERRSWNESYLLRSFLSYNNAFQITLFNSWIWQEHPEVVQRYLPESSNERPGSIWFRRVA
jgi:predicted O-methyltransferase YrrM